MTKIIVSAPGKVILAGEHAVVYGYPALVAAIDKRLTLAARFGPTKKRYSGLVKYALSQILSPGEKADIKIDSQIPVGSGLGSSAALATGLVWALLPDQSEAIKNSVVRKIEDKQHGQSSGVDQTVVREGGAIKYVKGEGFEKVELNLAKAVLVDSGRPVETTGEMVAAVRRKLETRNSKLETIFKRIGEIAEDWRPELIRENQRLLEAIGVVGEKAKKVAREIEAIGGAAKVCGGGGVKRGSGMMLAYHEDPNKLAEFLKEKKWSFMEVGLGAEGGRHESV